MLEILSRWASLSDVVRGPAGVRAAESGDAKLSGSGVTARGRMETSRGAGGRGGEGGGVLNLGLVNL